MSGGPHLCYWEESGHLSGTALTSFLRTAVEQQHHEMIFKKSQFKIRLDEMWTLFLSVVSWVSLNTSPNCWPLTRVTFLWKPDICCFPEGLSPELSPQKWFFTRSSTCHHWAWGFWSTYRRLAVAETCCGYREPQGPEYEGSCLPKAHGNHGRRKGRGPPW